MKRSDDSYTSSTPDVRTANGQAGDIAQIWLDYSGAAKAGAVVGNLSAVRAVGKYLWTVSDEGRTVECLEPYRRGYRLRRQYRLDAIFRGLPGKATGDEADLEAMDSSDGRLWLSGSHCRVRLEPDASGAVQPGIRPRRSRHLFGTVKLDDDGGTLSAPGIALPFAGKGSLRRRLRNDPHLGPYLGLPSKENGLDIEGLAVTDNRVFLGLRGPVLDSFAVAVELERGKSMLSRASRHALHFLDLGGAGIRDLARHDSTILVLAGPVTGADSPFSLYQWRPRRTPRPQRPTHIHTWPVNGEHPEGICPLSRNGNAGLLVLYDGPDKRRVDGNRYRADWLSLEALRKTSDGY